MPTRMPTGDKGGPALNSINKPEAKNFHKQDQSHIQSSSPETQALGRSRRDAAADGRVSNASQTGTITSRDARDNKHDKRVLTDKSGVNLKREGKAVMDQDPAAHAVQAMKNLSVREPRPLAGREYPKSGEGKLVGPIESGLPKNGVFSRRDPVKELYNHLKRTGTYVPLPPCRNVLRTVHQSSSTSAKSNIPPRPAPRVPPLSSAPDYRTPAGRNHIVQANAPARRN